MRDKRRAVDAGADLVEQDDAGLPIKARPSSRSFFWPPERRAGLVAGELVEFEKGERLAGAVIDLFLFAAIMPAAEGGVENIVARRAVAGDHQILDDGEAGEFLRDLERAGETEMGFAHARRVS